MFVKPGSQDNDQSKIMNSHQCVGVLPGEGSRRTGVHNQHFSSLGPDLSSEFLVEFLLEFEKVSMAQTNLYLAKEMFPVFPLLQRGLTQRRTQKTFEKPDRIEPGYNLPSGEEKKKECEETREEGGLLYWRKRCLEEPRLYKGVSYFCNRPIPWF